MPLTAIAFIGGLWLNPSFVANPVKDDAIYSCRVQKEYMGFPVLFEVQVSFQNPSDAEPNANIGFRATNLSDQRPAEEWHVACISFGRSEVRQQGPIVTIKNRIACADGSLSEERDKATFTLDVDKLELRTNSVEVEPYKCSRLKYPLNKGS